MISGLSRILVRERLIHWALIFFVILFVSLMVIIRPLQIQYAKVHHQKEELSFYIVKIKETMTRAEGFEKGLSQKREELENLKEATLEPGEQAKVISLLTQITHDLNISILSMKPIQAELSPLDPVQAAKQIEPIMFQMEMVSSYKQLVAFFEELQKAPLLLGIKEFETAPQEKNQEFLRTQIVLIAYQEKAAK